MNCLTYEGNTREPYIGYLRLFVLLLSLSTDIISWKKNSKFDMLSITGMDGLSPNELYGVLLFKNLVVEYLLMLRVLLFDLDIVNENVFKELARQIASKITRTERFLRYNNKLSHLTIFSADFEAFR